MALTPKQRSMRASAAALIRWSQEDPRPQMQAARDKFDKRFEQQVDPDGVLPEPERRRRVAAARKAYFTALALKSSRARRKG